MILFIKHVEIEGPEILGAFFEQAGYAMATVALHRGWPLPADAGAFDAVVFLGGPMNVYEEARYPFLKDEDVFLKKALARKVPVLGICLGAQLLAKASGGSVVCSPQPEIGWCDITLTPDGLGDPLLRGFDARAEVFQWHGDMCQPPAGAVLLASSEACPVQAFRYGTNAYGLQFHAEITDKSIRDWCQAGQRTDEAMMLARYQQIKDNFLGQGQALCRNFLQVIKESKEH